MPADVIEILSDLIRLPSVNPMGRCVQGDIYFEARVTAYLEDFFRRQNWPFARQTVEPGRDNIVARIDGDVAPERGGRLIVLEAHQDTVPIEGMTIPAFEPNTHDGKLYGRGSCDIKGALACILAAAVRLSQERPAGRPNVLLVFPVNEEHGFNGARAVADTWSGQRTSLSELIPRKPDAAIVAEPTLLDVVAAHKGVVRWKCHVHGKACHSSQPELGESAIYAMAKVISALERYAKSIVGTLAEHPMLSRPTLNVGTIEGGLSVNTVPAHCVIEIDRRIVPVTADHHQGAQQHVIDYLAREVPDVKISHDVPYILSPGLSDRTNAELVARVSAIAQSCGSPGRKIGVPYGTDAPAYDSTGVPTVVFGPGSIAQAHTADEWIAVDQLHAGVEAYYRIAKELS